MKAQDINEARKEAKRFLKRIKELKESDMNKIAFMVPGRTYIYTSKESGALKRSSMDLTRALSKMRL